MAVPVIESKSSATDNALTATSITITTPTGATTGDTLVVVLGESHPNATATFNEHADFTRFVNDIGAGAPDACLSVQWHRLTAAPPANYTFTTDAGNTNGSIFALMYRISGANAVNPIHVVGTVTGDGNLTSHVAGSITTTIADCLAMAALSFDGGDGSPFSTAGTGWTEEDDITTANDPARASGTVATKSMATAGATGDVTFTSTVADGSVQVQWAIAPVSGGTQTLTPTLHTAGATLNGPALARVPADRIYPSAQSDLIGGGMDLTTLDLKCVLIDLDDYTYDSTDVDLGDVLAGAQVAISSSLTNPTVTRENIGGIISATFSADPVFFASVTGDDVETLILYENASPARLIAYLSTGGKLIQPSGGNVTVTFANNRILVLKTRA